jgi:hypothetical protein
MQNACDSDLMPNHDAVPNYGVFGDAGLRTNGHITCDRNFAFPHIQRPDFNTVPNLVPVA